MHGGTDCVTTRHTESGLRLLFSLLQLPRLNKQVFLYLFQHHHPHLCIITPIFASSLLLKPRYTHSLLHASVISPCTFYLTSPIPLAFTHFSLSISYTHPPPHDPFPHFNLHIPLPHNFLSLIPLPHNPYSPPLSLSHNPLPYSTSSQFFPPSSIQLAYVLLDMAALELFPELEAPVKTEL